MLAARQRRRPPRDQRGGHALALAGGQAERPGAAGRRHAAHERWIERADLAGRQPGGGGEAPEIGGRGYGERVEGDGIDLVEVEAVAVGIAADHRRRVDLRHELLRLAPQVARLGERPEVARAGLLDRARHLDLAGVVRGLGERPRAELVVEVAQVRRGGDRGLLGIEPLIHPAIDAQAVSPRRAGHELPHALGAHPRHGVRLEATLDHRGEREIFGQAARAQHLADHGQVTTRAVHPERHDLTAAAGEPIEVELHLGVEHDRIGRGHDGRIGHAASVAVRLRPPVVRRGRSHQVLVPSPGTRASHVGFTQRDPERVVRRDGRRCGNRTVGSKAVRLGAIGGGREKRLGGTGCDYTRAEENRKAESCREETALIGQEESP